MVERPLEERSVGGSIPSPGTSLASSETSAVFCMNTINNNNKTRIDSFKIAHQGLIHAIASQKNFQIQLVIGIVALIAARLLDFSRMEWLILIITIAIVLAAELLNTVVEIVVDLAVKEKLLPDAKLAKDVSAAAVLLIAIFSVVVGLILFIPHLF